MNHHSAAHHGLHDPPGHRHGIIDPAIASTDRGMWALKWSFFGLLATAMFQVVVVVISGSVALLADTIHNCADAATAIPLAIAFAFARLKPSRRFPYGFGRVEDLAGVLIVVTRQSRYSSETTRLAGRETSQRRRGVSLRSTVGTPAPAR